MTGAGQAAKHCPHPSHAAATMTGRPPTCVIAPGVGQRSTHTAQNDESAKQRAGSTRGTIVGGNRGATIEPGARRALVSEAGAADGAAA